MTQTVGENFLIVASQGKFGWDKFTKPFADSFLSVILDVKKRLLGIVYLQKTSLDCARIQCLSFIGAESLVFLIFIFQNLYERFFFF